MSVSLAEIGQGRLREQFSTKKRLTTAAVRQDKRMLEGLKVLRRFLENEINLTRDAASRQRLREYLNTEVPSLEALEGEDVQTNGLRVAVDDAEGRQMGLVAKPKPLPKTERRWRP